MAARLVTSWSLSAPETWKESDIFGILSRKFSDSSRAAGKLVGQVRFACKSLMMCIYCTDKCIKGADKVLHTICGHEKEIQNPALYVRTSLLFQIPNMYVQFIGIVRTYFRSRHFQNNFALSFQFFGSRNHCW
jgi:hypothetical protein